MKSFIIFCNYAFFKQCGILICLQDGVLSGEVVVSTSLEDPFKILYQLVALLCTCLNCCLSMGGQVVSVLLAIQSIPHGFVRSFSICFSDHFRGFFTIWKLSALSAHRACASALNWKNAWYSESRFRYREPKLRSNFCETETFFLSKCLKLKADNLKIFNIWHQIWF